MVHVCVVEQCSSQICLHQARPDEVRTDKSACFRFFLSSVVVGSSEATPSRWSFSDTIDE